MWRGCHTCNRLLNPFADVSAEKRGGLVRGQSAASRVSWPAPGLAAVSPEPGRRGLPFTPGAPAGQAATVWREKPLWGLFLWWRLERLLVWGCFMKRSGKNLREPLRGEGSWLWQGWGCGVWVAHNMEPSAGLSAGGAAPRTPRGIWAPEMAASVYRGGVMFAQIGSRGVAGSGWATQNGFAVQAEEPMTVDRNDGAHLVIRGALF